MAEIGINLRADPSAFIDGTKQAEKAVDDWEKASVEGADNIADKLEAVIRAMVKLGTESGKSSDDIARDLRNLGLDAEQAEDAVAAVWREMGEGQRAARDVERAAESLEEVDEKAKHAADSTRDVGKASKDAGDDFSTLGDIARDVLEGDFGSAAENAIGSLAALGVFAGAGGALASVIGEGVGAIVGDFIGQWDRAARETEQRISDMFDDFLESGQSYLSQQFIDAKIGELITNTEEWNRIREESALIGEHESTLLRANAGDLAAVNDAISAAKERRAELVAEGERYIEVNGRENAAITDQVSSIDLLIQKLAGVSGEQDTAAAKAEAARAAMEESAAANHRTADSLDRVADSARNVPDGKTVTVTADTTAFYAQMEAIRQARYSTSVGIDIVINERRGRTIP